MKLTTLSVLLLAACGAAAEDYCEYRKSLDFEVDADGLQTLNIDAGAGELTVLGSPDASRVAVKATACASTQKLLDGLELDRQRSGRTLTVRTSFPEEGWKWMGKQYAYLHLEMRVPETLELEVEDGSGPVLIERVAAVTIDDGSGELELRDIGGALHIDDGSGAIRVRTVAGDVFVRDGSGEIDITGVEGDLTIEEDGSGEIEIGEVTGTVAIDEDGSGDIRVTSVGGSVLIRRDGSGGIQVRKVAGDLEVGRDGGGAISYRDVDGRVSLPPDRSRRR